MRPLFSLCLFLSIGFAYDIDSLSKEPAGYARDLFLLRELEQNITKEDAYRGYFLTKTPKSEHSSLLLKKTKSKKLATLFDCMDSNITRVLKKTPECAELGINYKKISSAILSGSDEPQKLLELIKDSAPQKKEKIEVLLKTAAKKEKLTKDSIELYFESSKEFRASFFDMELNDDELKSVVNSPFQKRFIKWALFDKNATTLQKSISKIEPRELNDSEALFFLGLLKLRHEQNATLSFERAAKTATKESDKDRANFWAYLSSKDDKFLQKASSGKDFNFYSVIATEMSGKKPTAVEFVSLDNENAKFERNISSPFEWLNFKRKINNASNKELETILIKTKGQKYADAYYLQAKERLEGYKKELYLMPYQDAFADYNDSQKTLLHAIGRQESLFIPGIVSSAYAIGVMQIIPILGEELAAKRKEKFDFFELFEPKKNISYAATHFKWLESKVSHPTLIAVSFNAGYGFFKRIERDGLFVFKDEKTLAYEPFWSIENIPYDETRHYAKKVSLNYAVYSRRIGKEVSLSELLENLMRLRRQAP